MPTPMCATPPARGQTGKPFAGGLLQNWPLHVTLLACAAILIARKLEAVANPQFWAEDGTVFFHDAYVLGWHAFAHPYAGYLHVLPRFVAAIGSWFDPLWAPLVYVLGALALTLYTAALTQSSRSAFPTHPAFALAVVLVPDAGEVLLCLANIQWVTTAALLLVLLSADGKRWWQQAHDVTAVILIGLTGPASVLLAPLFVLRAVRRKTAASHVLCAVALVVAAIQVRAICGDLQLLGVEGHRVAAAALPKVPGLRIGASLFAGTFVGYDYAWSVAVAMSAVTAVFIAALALRHGAAREARIVMAIVLVALLAAALYRCRHDWETLRLPGFGARYFFPMQLIVLWLILATACDRPRWVARSAAAAFVWIVAVNVPRLHESVLPDHDWASAAAKIRTGKEVSIAINPDPWQFTLPATNRGK